MNRFIEVDEVIANASTFIKDMSDELSLIMRQWVWFAMRDIGPSNDLIETANVAIIDGSAKKPSDMTGNIISLGVYDEAGNEINYRYNYSASQRVRTGNIKTGVLNIYEDRDYVHFSEHEDCPLSYIVIRYFKMPLDDCGMPLVPESHLNAVMAYLKFAFYYREANDSSMIGFSRSIWMDERAKIRSKNKSVAGIRAEQIMKSWMSIIPNMRYNKF